MTNRSYLEQLYYGNVSPMERSISKNSKLKKIMNIVSDEIEKFNTKLTEEQQKELDKLLCLKTTEACQMEIDAFVEYLYPFSLIASRTSAVTVGPCFFIVRSTI